MKRILLGVSGASGSIYAIETARYLLQNNNEVYLTFTKAAADILKSELKFSTFEDAIGDIAKSPNFHIRQELDFFAEIASGSFKFDAMAITPCSANTLGKIAYGIADNLLCRCASVALKEKRKLVLVLRETPLAATHLQSALTVANAGGIILPACPAFYSNEQTFSDLVNFVVGKTISAMGLEQCLIKEWGQQ